ncbi:MAG: response regulator transcription factor [Bacteriovoracaceae bacterium]|nr:response regulator transcription factor [Bacteriovoracaceae bacterium]
MNLVAVNTNILILEDEIALSATLSEYLSDKGLSCKVCHTCEEARNILAKEEFKIALLDIDLPDGTGLEIGTEMRKKNPQTIILFASAMNDPTTKLAGLEMGAQDFITKPFHLKELQMRLEKILGLQKLLTADIDEIKIGKLSINFASFLSQDAYGNKIHWSHKECSILKILYDAKGKVVTRDEIIDLVWGENAFPSHRTVDNYIVSLRKWAETDPNHSLVISNIRGVGYKLEIL